MGFLSFIFGDTNQKEINRFKPIVNDINKFEPILEKKSEKELKNRIAELKQKIQQTSAEEQKQVLDDILPEVFAYVREAAKRTIGQRHFDVQLMGGLVLHQGKIAEMRTGEGKTLVATLPLVLNALVGKGAHLVTVNDYLSKRDAVWMGQIYNYLGLQVSAIGHEQSFLYDPEAPDKLSPCSRKDAYRADITYGTNNEFGFDYLRDNMAQSMEQLVQRQQHFAIVDEVDSILIDEARTPLIISAPAEESASLYTRFAQIAQSLEKDKDYKVDEKMHAATITSEGMKKVEGLIGVDNIYTPEGIALAHHLEEALQAEALFQKDRDYVVKAGEVIIVDEFTGRLMPGRRYSEGLHQAIEAKEGVEIKRESDTLATISFQNLFRMYQKLAGMTGTAATEAEEFFKIYSLDVVIIPTNKEMIREDRQDKIYKTEEAKFKAIVGEITERNQAGQPVLVGTISIEKSEHLSKMLGREGIRHQVLNAKHHEQEAKIIAQAGKPAAVTVATNMAGRGVDIVLGGNPNPPGEAAPTKEKIKEWEKLHQQVIELGGLHIIGTERHEARRIDNQLRGRSGRQGDPGSSQFFVSMEDDLMRIFGGDRLKSIMGRLGLPDDQPINHQLISRSIESAQKRVEGHNFDIRKHLVDYDDVMNKHREVIYRKRREILEGKSVRQDIIKLLDEEGKKVYQGKIAQYGDEMMAQIERAVYLRTIDLLWIEHLNAMDQLREGIGLRGYAQKDPLVEYKEAAYHLFQKLLQTINNQVVDILLKVEARPAEVSPQPRITTKPIEMKGASEQAAAGTFEEKAQISQPEPVEEASPMNASGGVQVTVRSKSSAVNQPTKAVAKVGRNDPCPCGAKKPDGRPVKYKHCHGK